MTIQILHLSDIHIEGGTDPVLARYEKIASSIYKSLPDSSHVFIVISGDIAYSGKREQYEAATRFLNAIRECIVSNCTSHPEVHFIITPGNHDCDFDANNGARIGLINSLEHGTITDVDDSIISICTSPQREFFSFRSQLETPINPTDDLLLRNSTFATPSVLIEFACLNVSWTSKLKEEPGRMLFPIERYADSFGSGCDIRVVVLHHPLNWFSQTVYRAFRRRVRGISDILITGHEHCGNIGTIQDTESGTSAFVEGCVLQDTDDPSNSSFNVITLDTDRSQFRAVRYEWDGNRYIENESGSWVDYRNVPRKATNAIAIEKTFFDVLDDAGAFFNHPAGVTLTLSDIFVFPDLRRLNGTEDNRSRYVNSSTLLDISALEVGVLIEGEEKAGATSLLHQLYLRYHAQGYLPLLLKGKDLRRSTARDIDSLIRKSTALQYGESAVTAVEQFPASKRLLLVDDFDQTPIRSAAHRNDLIHLLRGRFRHIVFTVGETFEIRELVDGQTARGVSGLDHYRIQPFGFSLRSKLIERWFSLGADGTLDEGDFIALCDRSERIMDATMTKMVIPSVPIYLLTLLQSVEAGRSGEFKDTGLGYYYQYLLTEAFQNSGVKAEKLTEMFQYSAHLAWEFHLQQASELSISILMDFNARFSRQWVTVDFLSSLEILISARVLCRVGDEYAFRYPYIYYFLKGQYLSENLNDLGNRAYISHCASHLYVRDYANTILFLAHHTNDEFVINAISDALHGLFKDTPPLALNGDLVGISKLIEEAPKLGYSGGSPKAHRERRRELRDELDDGDDGLAEEEERSDVLSKLAQVTMLMRTTDILGQVLKNQYAKIDRRRKADLLQELFNGPLRALSDILKLLLESTDLLVTAIEEALDQKELSRQERRRGSASRAKPLGGASEQDRKVVARRVVSRLVEMVGLGFIFKAAQAANSESLLEDVDSVVKKNGTLAFRLIEACILLDSPKAIPRSKLRSIFKDGAAQDVFADRLLKIMIVNRLYMFKTSEKDMQWLSTETNLDIKTQHSITYADEKGRFIKG